MFTGFASENTPAIQVWDFSGTFASSSAIRSVSLSDDCAPIQYFKTGGAALDILVYLPTAPIDGKQITIVNTRYTNNNQLLSIRSSDKNQNGASADVYSGIGPGQTLRLVYSKEFINAQNASGSVASTGWLSLDMGAAGSTNFWCAVVGGSGNIAASSNGGRAAVIGGSLNRAINGSAVVVGGSSNTADATFAGVLAGQINSATGSNAVVIGGLQGVANNTNSAVVGGANGTARSIVGNLVTPASSNPIQNAIGIQQLGTLLLGRQTTDATATVLRSDTGAAGTQNQVILPNNSAYYVKGSVIATVTGGGNTKSWDFIATIKRGANAASTAIVGAVTLNVQAADAGASTWVVAITADTTNGGLAVTVTGQAATTIRWVAKLESTEVTY
jgi:hypothetical protein